MARTCNNKLRFLLLLSVLAIIISSGCTTGTTGGTGGGPGIVVEKFMPSLDTIESGEPVSLQLEVRNKGDYNNALAVVELMDIDPTEWVVGGGTIRDLGTLLAPDPESQTEGGLATTAWELTSPLLKRGQRLTYPVRARVYYTYETSATKPVWFVTSEELRRIVQLGDALPSEATIYTGGPLTVTINAGQFVKAREWRESKFQLQIRIQNSGNGQIRGRNYPVAMEVTWPTWVTPVKGACPEQIQWGTVLYNDIPPGLPQPTGTYIMIWDGRSTDVTCEFMIVNPPASRTKGDFEVKLNYIYSVDATTQITVKGMEEFI
jgi:hypothetical protein